MTTSGSAPARLTEQLGAAFARRENAGQALLSQAGGLVQAARAMAGRFEKNGRLFTFGVGVAAADAQHVAVEFLHPVIVGTRALPAIALTNDPSLTTDTDAAGLDVFAGVLRTQGTPGDIALGLSLQGRCPSVARGLQAAGQLGMLTIGLAGGELAGAVARHAQHGVVVAHADVLAVREMLVTAYHILWELTHCFLGRGSGGSP
jgi:D-sedoheptulose 7-phosphate isomerase